MKQAILIAGPYELANRLLPLLLNVLLIACSNSRSPATDIVADHSIDTTKAKRVGRYWVTPKPSFKYNTSLPISSDTLVFVTCADYVFSPFGHVTNKDEIKRGLLKKFSVHDRVDTVQFVPEEYQIAKYRSSRLIYWFDSDPDASRHFSIIKGDILDDDVLLLDSIRTGMSKAEFVAKFFDAFPDKLMDQYNIIAFESCVSDIRHTYLFKDGYLSAINFQCHCIWDVSY